MAIIINFILIRSVHVVVLEALPHLLSLHRPDALHRHRRVLLHAAQAQEGKFCTFNFGTKYLEHKYSIQVFRFPGGIWAIESLYFEVSKTVWTFFMLCLMLARFKSSFLCTFWVLFPMLGRYVGYDKPW